jgi:thioredoxin-like negative regulator of GroEL
VTERIAIALAVIAASALLLLATRAYLGWRRSRVVMPAEAGRSTGVPTLVYLRTAECAVCPQQARVVDALAGRHADGLRVVRVDALVEPELADRYGVWTVPATIVIDGAGRTVAVNCGLASVNKLERQIESALEAGSDGEARSSREPARAA